MMEEVNLQRFFEDAITIVNPVNELPSVLQQLTADRMMAIVSAAEAGDTRELFALYRDVIAADTHIISEFGKRKAAILGDVASVTPYDKKVEDDHGTKDACQLLVDTEPFYTMLEWLLNATLYPVAVVEKVYRPYTEGFMLEKVVPVPYQLLDYSGGTLRIFDVDPESGRTLQTSHEPDPARYIVHRGHALPIPDQWGGPMRAVLFWWLLRTMSRQWWANFIERFGIPFLMGKYANDEGRRILTQAFQLAVRLGGLVLSKDTEAQLIQAGTGDTTQSHERFIQTCNDEISKLIVGQVLSAQSKGTGELGGGTAGLQGQVRDDLRLMDAKLLGNTIRAKLFTQFLAVNAMRGRAPIITFGSVSPAEMKAISDFLNGLSGAGIEVDDDALETIAERAGFGLRRKISIPPFPLSAHPFPLSADARSIPYVDQLADAFRGRYSAIADIIRNSESPEDCIKLVREWALKNDVKNPAHILEQALNAYACHGARSSSRTPQKTAGPDG